MLARQTPGTDRGMGVIPAGGPHRRVGAMAGGAGSGRIVLCVPRRCGLNDILVQVWLSYQDARASDRRLVIDTRLAGLWDDFGRYFQPRTAALRAAITTRVSDEDIAAWNDIPAVPAHLSGQLDFLYRETRLRMAGDRHTSRTRRIAEFTAASLRRPEDGDWPLRRRLRFLTATSRRIARDADLAGDTTADAPVVVHHRTGGGAQSLLALRLFRLTPPLQSAVRRALAAAGPDFDALHIRNTDLAGNYRSLLHDARTRLAGRRVLVCSDDAAVIGEARRTLLGSEVFTVTRTEDTGGAPLHKVGALRPLPQRRLLATNQIVDLLTLAHSRQLFVAPTRGGGLSGYSRLAQLLHEDRGLRDDLLTPEHVSGNERALP